MTDLFDEWCRRCESQAELTLHQTQQYHYPHTLFTRKELELAEHARTRLQHMAEHNEWLDAQKKKWATEKLKRDAGGCST